MVTTQEALRHVNNKIPYLIEPIIYFHGRLKMGEVYAGKLLSFFVSFSEWDLIMEAALREKSRIGIAHSSSVLSSKLPRLKSL